MLTVHKIGTDFATVNTLPPQSFIPKAQQWEISEVNLFTLFFAKSLLVSTNMHQFLETIQRVRRNASDS